MIKSTFKRFTLMSMFCLLQCMLLMNAYAITPKEAQHLNITIDGTKTDTEPNKAWRGAGMISANNSSRLLLDYKAEQPEVYWKLLDYLFGEDGVQITHLKIEMGADVNTSSGTEPSVKRTIEEVADVTRGAGFQLAADAKKINKDLTLDMLWWGEPGWIERSNSNYNSATEELIDEEIFAARYRWYKETLDAAYKTYGLVFDYVSANQNEHSVDAEWIKYLSKHLKSEKYCPYDYAKIKIVAADEVCRWNIADRMLADKELLDAVDVIGSHYTSWSTDNAKKLVNENGKEAWFSEASSPMSYAQSTFRFDGFHSGIEGLNGALDVANRIITMYSGGFMTLYEYQPVIAAYYNGVNYCQKQLILADKPWCGDYLLDSGFFMSLHFSQFIKKGWQPVSGACYADGKAGGDGHAIADAKYSYLTAVNPATGDWSTVVTNTTRKTITYTFTVSNLQKSSAPVYVWETRGPDSIKDKQYDKNYFKKIDTITPTTSNGVSTFTVAIKPHSILSISTLAIADRNTESGTQHYSSLAAIEDNKLSERSESILKLPYTDDFEYTSYPKEYLSSRGNAPRYTTDEGGAFEVQKGTTLSGKNSVETNVLMQMITDETRGEEWGSSPSPMTTLGDDCWFNYSVTADVKFAPLPVKPKTITAEDEYNEGEEEPEDYVGVGLRCNYAASNGMNGYWLKVQNDGTWNLYHSRDVLFSGKYENFDPLKWNKLKIAADKDVVTAYINGTLVQKYVCKDESLLAAGRVALYSSYNNNMFDNMSVEPIGKYFITRYDQMDGGIQYSGEWDHNTLSGYGDYKRTKSTGAQNAKVSFTFDGTGFALTGQSRGTAVLKVVVDGTVVDEAYDVKGTSNREIAYYHYGLKNGEHLVEVTVVHESFCLDGIEILGK